MPNETDSDRPERHLREILLAAAIEAGQTILRVKQDAAVRLKADRSPVTDADEMAETAILAALSARCPDIPVIAEESMAAGTAPVVEGDRFFLVDALDGTREFISGKDDYTVNIALVVEGVPVAGVVYAPEKNVIYSAVAGEAEKALVNADGTMQPAERLTCRKAGAEKVALVSRSHDCAETGTYLAAEGVGRSVAIGSSLKFCLLAEGVADVYPRFTRTMQWDTAAGDAILRAAGGLTVGEGGAPLRYGLAESNPERDFANPFFVAHAQKPGRSDG